MCCNKIDTDTLMANLFVESLVSNPSCHEIKFSIDQLNGYFKYVSVQFPVYVASNFSEQAIYECVLKYPTYYRFIEEGNTKFIKSGKENPNLDLFNAIYSKNISTYIRRITKKYLDIIGNNSSHMYTLANRS